MNKLISWISKKRWRSSLSHVLLSVPMFAVIYALAYFLGFDASSVAATFVVAWWWSREKTQHEYRLKGANRTFTVWKEGWLPFEWNYYSVLDLALPTALAIALALLIS